MLIHIVFHDRIILHISGAFYDVAIQKIIKEDRQELLQGRQVDGGHQLGHWKEAVSGRDWRAYRLQNVRNKVSISPNTFYGVVPKSLTVLLL